MANIRTINSEVDIRKDIVKNLKQYRVINQTALYLDTGADLYYNPNKRTSLLNYDYTRIVRLIESILDEKKGAKIAIVSLACGYCQMDKIILEHLKEKEYNISFFGIDSSLAMVKKAEKTLHDVAFEANLICADFGASNFKGELDKIIGNYELGIYLFFGNTLGNLNQGYITDILKGILNTGDYLLLDVAGFETITTTTQAKLFQRYVSYLKSPAEAEFFLSPLKAFGVSENHGKLILDITKDDATQAQVFIFKFKVTKSINFDLEGEEVGLTLNESIDLYKILVYDLNELAKFLNRKSFEFKEQILGEYHNQLLLQRQ